MKYLLRAPKFPVIVDTGDKLIAAKTKVHFERRVGAIPLDGKNKILIIDRTAEAFALYPDKMVVAPHIGIRRWTKSSIIDLYNERKPAQAHELGKRSLGSRSLEQIVNETVELLSCSL